MITANPSEIILNSLSNCGRVLDFQGEVLTVEQLKEIIYELRRYRQADGATSDVVDVATNDFLKEQFRSVLKKYFDSMYGSPVMIKEAWIPNLDVYRFPDITTGLAVASVGNKDPNWLWFILFSDLVDFEPMTPQKHLVLTNVDGLKE